MKRADSLASLSLLALLAATPIAASAAPDTQAAVLPWNQLSDASILADPRGQWASDGSASSQFRPADYSARQAIGAPDVPTYADDKRAWSPSTAERQPEWLELTYPNAVYATELRVRQSFNPGTIVQIEAIAADGATEVLWQGRDPNSYAKDQIAWFVVRFPKTAFAVQRVKLTLNTPAAKGWKQIDAVQLVGDQIQMGAMHKSPRQQSVAPAVAPATTPTSDATTETSKEPAWPQQFELAANERASFGFAAGQAGPISISVQAQGAPFTLRLTKPGGAVMDWQGHGKLDINYSITAADLQKGILWAATISSAQSPAGDKTTRSKFASVISGSIRVQHPPADAKVVQAQVNAHMQQAKTQQHILQVVPASDSLAQAKAELKQERASAHLAQLDAMRSSLPVAAQKNMELSIKAGGEANVLAESEIPASPGASQGSPAMQPGAWGSAATAVVPPVINSLSVNKGDSGTPVWIKGSGFGTTPGKVYMNYDINSKYHPKKEKMPVYAWSPNEIIVKVPWISMPQNTMLYVSRSDGVVSAQQPFHYFILTTAVLEIPTMSAGFLVDSKVFNAEKDFDRRTKSVNHVADWFFGNREDDEFYLQARLKNGWKVISAKVTSPWSVSGWYRDCSASNVAIAEFRPDTDSPYVKVHWWTDAWMMGGCGVRYRILITIRGPLGLPAF
ncbi:MAG: hypothetical protein GC149_15075 [Gammaproteobacteria bacterium]|nr:hypothetical protein [Gammaproteobacteria bacterium]